MSDTAFEPLAKFKETTKARNFQVRKGTLSPLNKVWEAADRVPSQPANWGRFQLIFARGSLAGKLLVCKPRALQKQRNSLTLLIVFKRLFSISFLFVGRS